MMKDLYSIHADEDDFWKFYESVKSAYGKIFKRIGFDYKITEAGGGVFTDNFTHEFQVPADGGEDLIYICTKCDWAVNKEVFDSDAVKSPLDDKHKKSCPVCKSEVASVRSIEVGNIFPFGTYYSEKMKITFADKSGKSKHPYFGSYGIGSTRVMGTWIETSAGHDDKGIIWPSSIAPFDVHLVDLNGDGDKIYKKLNDAGIDVLWDDREVGAGTKFTDADLIGIPVRLVISDKTDGKIERKRRNESEVKILDLDDIIKSLN